VERVAQAREKLSSLKRELSASDLFCVDCRYLKGSDCHNPAVKTYAMDPVTGTIESHPFPARAARDEKGGCGPEAALFDPRPEPLVAAKAAWSGVMNAVAMVVGAFVLVALAAQLLS
jgi:hypothetical protein